MVEIHKKIERFLAETGMAHSTFGRMAANNKNVVKALRSGRDIRTKTAERIERFMAEYEAREQS